MRVQIIVEGGPLGDAWVDKENLGPLPYGGPRLQSVLAELVRDANEAITRVYSFPNQDTSVSGEL